MSGLREVIIFSEQGDPRLIKTWSNVPFFLVRTLENKGVKVNTVNLSVTSFVEKVARRIHDFIYDNLAKGTHYPYSTSLICHYFNQFKIRGAIRRCPQAELYIFTTFSISASRISKKPSVLFCDWTIEHYLKYFFGRTPNYLERLTIRRQEHTIEHADFVFVLFPTIAREMKGTFTNPNIYYNGNVVNSLATPDSDIVNYKQAELSLLFIGSPKYIQGARELVKAFSLLKSKYPRLKAHLVGITSQEIANPPDGVELHGYLDKGNPGDIKKYYELLRTSSVFVNTNPKWASFSSSLEAMYFFTPVIVTAYSEFVGTFGKEINFGRYYEHDSRPLDELIDGVLSSSEYRQMSINAHEAAMEHSWDGFVDRMMNKISA